jgi:hypothetical protein
MRNASILVGNLEWKKLHGRGKFIWDSDIKMDSIGAEQGPVAGSVGDMKVRGP